MIKLKWEGVNLKNYKKYNTLFTTAFRLSAFTFGGGYVIVPLMRKQFVENLNWIDETEMMDMMAIAQSAPGSLAVNATILVGYKIGGFWGSLIGMLGTALPPLLLLSIISFSYSFFKTNPYINATLSTMAAAVAAIVFDVVIKMTTGVVKSKNNVSLFVMIVSFLAAYILKINVVLIILGAGLFGAINSRRKTL